MFKIKLQNLALRRRQPLLVCLFVWSFRSRLGIFHWRSHHYLQMALMVVRSATPLVTSVYMVIYKNRWHSHLFPIVCSWAVTTCFNNLKSVATGDRTLISHMQTLYHYWWTVGKIRPLLGAKSLSREGFLSCIIYIYMYYI